MLSRTQFFQSGLVPVPYTWDLLQEECTVCSDAYTDAVSSPCHHRFCKACILRWLEPKNSMRTCPICRRVLFEQDEAKSNEQAHRLLVREAFQRSGLTTDSYFVFNSNITLSTGRMQRATFSAYRWLRQQDHDDPAGPATINRMVLAHHVIAMSNLLLGFAHASGRSYDQHQRRDLRAIICALFAVFKARHGRLFDALTLVGTLKDDIRSHLIAKGLTADHFLTQEIASDTCVGDLDYLLAYVSHKAAELFAEEDGQRQAVRSELMMVDKLYQWMRKYWRT